MMKIVFKDEIATMPPGSPSFKKGDVEVKTFDSQDVQVDPEGIDYTNGFITAYRTECLLPLSNPVTLSLLVTEDVEVKAFKDAVEQATHQFRSCEAFQSRKFTADINRLVIKAIDQALINANIESLEWTKLPDPAKSSKSPRKRAAGTAS
jgi:hypothetical protein